MSVHNRPGTLSFALCIRPTASRPALSGLNGNERQLSPGGDELFRTVSLSPQPGGRDQGSDVCACSPSWTGSAARGGCRSDAGRFNSPCPRRATPPVHGAMILVFLSLVASLVSLRNQLDVHKPRRSTPSAAPGGRLSSSSPSGVEAETTRHGLELER